MASWAAEDSAGWVDYSAGDADIYADISVR